MVCKVRDATGIGHMDNQRVVCRSPLGSEYFCHGLGAVGICREAVNGLGWEANNASSPYQ